MTDARLLNQSRVKDPIQSSLTKVKKLQSARKDDWWLFNQCPAALRLPDVWSDLGSHLCEGSKLLKWYLSCCAFYRSQWTRTDDRKDAPASYQVEITITDSWEWELITEDTCRAAKASQEDSRLRSGMQRCFASGHIYAIYLKCKKWCSKIKLFF